METDKENGQNSCNETTYDFDYRPRDIETRNIMNRDILFTKFLDK